MRYDDISEYPLGPAGYYSDSQNYYENDDYDCDDYYDYYDYYDCDFEDHDKLHIFTINITSLDVAEITKTLSNLKRSCDFGRYENVQSGQYIFSIFTYTVNYSPHTLGNNFQYKRLTDHNTFSLHVEHISGEYVSFEDNILFSNKAWVSKFNGNKSGNINLEELVNILCFCLKLKQYGVMI